MRKNGSIVSAQLPIVKIPFFIPLCFLSHISVLDSFFIAFEAVLAVLCIMLLGFGLRKAGRVSADTDQGLFRLIVDLLLPCLIFDKVVRTDAFADLQNLWLPPLLGFGMTAVGIGIGLCFVQLFGFQIGLTETKQRRTFAACIGLLNYGYIPIPIVATLFPGNDSVMGVLFLQNLGVEIAVWTLVVFTLSGQVDISSWRKIINGPLIAIFVAVPLNFFFKSGLVPESEMSHFAHYFEFIFTCIQALGQAAIPMSLIMVGLTIADLTHRGSLSARWKKTIRIAFCSCFLRLLVMPAIFLALALWLPCTMPIRQILVVHGAMGSAVFPIVLSQHYNGDVNTAFDTILSNTFLSIITLPFWISLGLSLVTP
ncbi:MAG: AEC family transporter [Thermoguttaceae bacterium]